MSRRSRPTSYLRLFLGALANEDASRTLRPEFRLYVFQAAKHAACFVSNPSCRVPRKWPEAVDLAFAIRDKGVLIDEIHGLQTANDILPELAKKLLLEFHSL